MCQVVFDRATVAGMQRSGRAVAGRRRPVGDAVVLFSLRSALGFLALALWIAATPGALHAATPVPLGSTASAPPELPITFEEAAVLAAELTPGGEALFFSIARVPLGYSQRVERRVEVVPVDPLGEAYYELGAERAGGGVPRKSVWAVVDLSSGAYGIAAPGGFVLDESPFPGNGFQVGAPGLVNRLRHTFAWVDLVLVRPGVGAWTFRASDGGGADRDGVADGRTVTALEDAAPVGAAPAPPDRFQAEDVIVVIDSRTLRFYATRLVGSPGGES